MAKDRGVDVYWFTWNAFIGPLEGKDGITSDKTAPRTIEYYRAAVRETIKTYPLLRAWHHRRRSDAGSGIQADLQGTMALANLWRGYSGWLEGHARPQVPAIHRFHMAGLTEIQTAFAELPCPLDLSYKYAIAHMYSVPNPA